MCDAAAAGDCAGHTQHNRSPSSKHHIQWVSPTWSRTVATVQVWGKDQSETTNRKVVTVQNVTNATVTKTQIMSEVSGRQ